MRPRVFAVLRLERSAAWRRFRQCVAVAAVLWAASAVGHGEASQDVTIELDAAPVALAGVKVALHRTLAHQLVVENSSQELLEVLSTDGRPFLRIGPSGVEADLAAAEWYRTYTAVGIPAPVAARDKRAPAQWTQVSRTAAWGWFDLRLRTDPISVPHKVVHAGRRAAIGRWKIPVRFAGALRQLTGTFQYAPPVSGYFEVRLIGTSEISPGVRVQVLPGTTAGLYLENRSAQPVTLLGNRGEAFLRIGPDGVQANVISPTWLLSGQAETTAVETSADAGAPPRWEERSRSPRFSWLDPRMRYPRDAPAQTPGRTRARGEVGRWEIPFLHGEEQRKISGAIDWVPLPETTSRSDADTSTQG
jgi:hypothetical protein